MHWLRISALAVVLTAQAVAASSAGADTFHYRVEISVPDGAGSWDAGTQSGQLQSAWSATWPDVAFDTTPAQQIARIEPASFPRDAQGRNRDPIPPKTAPVSAGASGAWSSQSANWSCTTPPGFGFSSFGTLPPLVLSGSGIDDGVKSESAPYAHSGLFGMYVEFEPRDTALPTIDAQCSGIDPFYNQLSPRFWVGVDSCFDDGLRTGRPLSFPVARLGEREISFTYAAGVGSADPPDFVCYDLAHGNAWSVTGTYHVKLTRTDSCQRRFPRSLGVSDGVLNVLEDHQFGRMQAYQRGLLGVMTILREDARRHPGTKRARRDLRTLKLVRRAFRRFVKDFRRVLDQGEFRHPPIKLDEESAALQPRPRARAAINEDERKVLDQALSCGLSTGKESLEGFIKEHGSKDEKKALELAGKLKDLGQVLSGRLPPGSADGKALLKSNLIGLGQTFGALDSKGRLPKAGERIYDLLTNDRNKLVKDLDSDVQSEVRAYAKKIAGKDGEELAKQLFVLRDVLSGKWEDDKEKQYKVLKDSLAALASRFVGEDVLKIPQVRAAMFGFELGRAFGDRIAADLKLVASTALVRECKLVIAKAQGQSVADIDYSKRTERFITADVVPGTTYANWICKVRPESRVEGVPGGVIEAISPVNTLFGRKIPLSDRLGVHLTGGGSVFFDTAYSNAG
jgi:hypothetical protein